MQPPHFPIHYVSHLAKTIIAISITHYIFEALTKKRGNTPWGMHVTGCEPCSRRFQIVLLREVTARILSGLINILHRMSTMWNLGPISGPITKGGRGGVSVVVPRNALY